jgi:hypothetical protein
MSYLQVLSFVLLFIRFSIITCSSIGNEYLISSLNDGDYDHELLQLNPLQEITSNDIEAAEEEEMALPPNPATYYKVQSYCGLWMNGYLGMFAMVWNYSWLDPSVDALRALILVLIYALLSIYSGYILTLKYPGSFRSYLPQLSFIPIKFYGDGYSTASIDQMAAVPLTWITGFLCFLPQRTYDSLDFVDRRLLFIIFSIQIAHCLGIFELFAWIIKQFHCQNIE